MGDGFLINSKCIEYFGIVSCALRNKHRSNKVSKMKRKNSEPNVVSVFVSNRERRAHDSVTGISGVCLPRNTLRFCGSMIPLKCMGKGKMLTSKKKHGYTKPLLLKKKLLVAYNRLGPYVKKIEALGNP